MTLRDLCADIEPLDERAMEAALRRQGQLTKPPGSLGRLETLAVQVAGIFGNERPLIRGKTVIIAAADHGVVDEGISGYPRAVSAQMVQNFLSGGAAINVLARHAGVTLEIVDAGLATALPEHSELRVLGIGSGTDNFARGPAMSREEAEACIRSGAVLAARAARNGADLIGAGDMGIGNTTSAAAITSAIAGRPAYETTGRGTGRSDDQLQGKIAVVERALEVNNPDSGDGLDVLAKVGGFEIGVLAGVMLGAAAARRIVVLDGFISTAAALIAHRICPAVGAYYVAAHLSAEQGHRVALSHLGLRPLLDLEMRLGEGTGAVLAMGLIDAATSCLREMSTFDEAGVSDSEALTPSETSR